MIQVGDRLPATVLREYNEVETAACGLGPQPVEVQSAVAGKTIVIVAVPGAFTPTCSEQHLPGFVELSNDIKQAGADDVWCVSVNDAYVMGAWARDQKTAGKVRLMADGSADFAQAVGITLELASKGFGLRSGRYSLVAVDGVVKFLNVESSPDFAAGDAAKVLEQVKSLKAA
jgi:peroxiredoxin